MTYPVNAWSVVDPGRAKCSSCGRRIRRGGGDVILRDLSGKARPRFFHIGGACEAVAQALIDGDPGRWKGARRHVRGGVPLMHRCAGFKRDGGHCTATVEPPQRYCWWHDPANADKRRRSASKAARSKPSRELVGIKSLLSDLTDRVLGGEGVEPLETGRAAVANQLINTRLRAVEVERKIKEAEELERRLEILEEGLEQRNDGKGGKTWQRA